MTIKNMPTIHNAPTIYNIGGGGGGGGVPTHIYKENISGKEYKIIEMPNGMSIMAQNLDMDFIGLNTNEWGTDSTPRAAYYNRDLQYKEYGYIYNWLAANYIQNNKSNLCPGWHLLTYAEALILQTLSYNRYNLCSEDYINGIDYFGFNMDGGIIVDNAGSFGGLHSYCGLWTDNSGQRLSFDYHNGSPSFYSVSVYQGSSIRLVKD